MPTQEERITMVEQTVTVLNRGIWDIYHHETMLLGMAIKQEEDLREIKSSLATLSDHLHTFEQSVNGRFEALEQRVNGRFEALEQRVNGRFEVLDGRIGTLERTVGALNGRIGTLERKVEALDNLIGTLERKVEALDNRIGTLERKVEALDGRIGTLERSINSRFEQQDKKFDQILVMLNTLIPKSD